MSTNTHDRPTATADARQQALTAFNASTPDLAPYLSALENVRHGNTIPPTLIGQAARCLTSIPLRDAVVVHMTGTTVAASPLTATTGPSDEDADRAMCSILDPSVGKEPGQRAMAHKRLLEHVVSHLPGSDAAPARSLLALTCWWEGDPASAFMHLEHALEADPSYRLAILLMETLAHGIQPGWARADHTGE